jgi:hypothetical protein
VVFVGIPAGFVTGLVYLFVARGFPRGLLGGAMYGASLLVLFSWWLDPLRAGNPDFDIVGPGWLAVTAFAAMAVLTGAVTAPIAGRIDAALGVPKRRWLWWIGPTGFLAAVAVVETWPAGLVVVTGSALYLIMPRGDERLRRRRRWALQAAVCLAVLMHFPASSQPSPTSPSAASASASGASYRRVPSTSAPCHTAATCVYRWGEMVGAEIRTGLSLRCSTETPRPLLTDLQG